MGFPKTFYRWRPHPWHGLEVGEEQPRIVNAYIEMTPFDAVKYEVDKATGYLRVDRPQLTSSMTPTLYGFILQTYCAKRVNALSPKSKQGDHDPLDICVITERPINRGEVILKARVIGGIQMIDNGEADDKIIAVLENDAVWSHVNDIDEVPPIFVERLRHYFMTYKMVPDEIPKVVIGDAYGREHAERVILASIEDYNEVFGGD